MLHAGVSIDEILGMNLTSHLFILDITSMSFTIRVTLGNPSNSTKGGIRRWDAAVAISGI